MTSVILPGVSPDTYVVPYCRFQIWGDTVAQEVVRDCSFREKWSTAIVGSLAALALFLAPALLPAAHAQKAEKPPRRVVQKVKPDYPMTMRAAHLGGLVRLRVTVSPSGNVTRIELLGGNAIFSESATKAVAKWTFAPAAVETTEEIQVRFNQDSPNTP
ncbi:MAG: energy transducer TonB [Terriglobales bacterium]